MAAMGGIPVTIGVTGTPDWIVVGGQTAELTVKVTNELGNPISGAMVTASSLDGNMGRITGSASGATNPNGLVYFYFQSGQKSGNAPIEMAVKYTDGTGIRDNTVTHYQKVDHDLPRYFDQIQYPFRGTVASNVSITVNMKDRFGNPVDSLRENDERRIAETVRYAISIESDGSIWDGITYVPQMYQRLQPVNEQGDSSVQIQLDTRTQNNYVHITAPPSVVSNQTGRNDVWIPIQGIADIPETIASSITSQFEPDPLLNHTASADGVDKFSILYVVYDRHLNPVPDVILRWNTSRGEIREFITNIDGRAFVTYGPSTEIQTVTLTVSNQTPAGTVWRNDTVTFIEGGPAIFTVAANPFTLASRDVNQNSSALILARVMDDMGRSIPGEVVHFLITADDSNTPQKLDSSFDPADDTNRSITVTTNADGYAIVVFYPGSFPMVGEDGYNPSATGSANIKVTWDDEPAKYVTISYMNFPYIRAETFVDPPTAEVNETVNITIQLIGEGYAPYAPVDAVLCTNRGESMLKGYVLPRGQRGLRGQDGVPV
jgi:hypothetical protein